MERLKDEMDSAMKIPALLCCLLAGALLLGVAEPSHAQEEPRQYKKFEIAPEFEKLFKERLQMEEQLGPLKDLIKKIAADPGKLPVDPAKLKDIKVNDDFKKALKDWATNDPQLRGALKDWIAKNPAGKQPDDAKSFHAELKRILEATNQKPSPVRSIPLRASATVSLHTAPAWNRAFEDLRTSINNPDAARFKLGDWQDNLKVPDGMMGNLGEGGLDRLRQLTTPDFKAWTPSLPEFGNVPMPDLSAPSLPRGPSLPSVGTSGTWVLLAVICLFVVWQLLRLSKRAAADARAALGPWPVRPEAVTTRAELVQAFDYLALLTLGLRVQSWNHHAVARQWRAKAPATTETKR